MAEGWGCKGARPLSLSGSTCWPGSRGVPRQGGAGRGWKLGASSVLSSAPEGAEARAAGLLPPLSRGPLGHSPPCHPVCCVPLCSPRSHAGALASGKPSVNTRARGTSWQVARHWGRQRPAISCAPTSQSSPQVPSLSAHRQQHPWAGSVPSWPSLQPHPQSCPPHLDPLAPQPSGGTESTPSARQSPRLTRHVVWIHLAHLHPGPPLTGASPGLSPSSSPSGTQLKHLLLREARSPTPTLQSGNAPSPQWPAPLPVPGGCVCTPSPVSLHPEQHPARTFGSFGLWGWETGCSPSPCHTPL